ncbi:hypothetical protein [Paraburkholderia caribensis]|uniref:hypothetical protein n=1 Tax=Paraburkholderia caribensis TaxID=75105 RepID=UPI00071EE6E6|nr:hypothetical protein [Paraburkholderia caribensis]ALP62844.1 hypothetical protein AN416_09700 [Paraburkholderia caribensis]AUT51925.1 hypothetical protein C2L66_08700 [Paraburkholderia caribensis]
MADAALLGALVGGAISLATSLASTVGAEAFKQRREARNLAYAFQGGINAILVIVEERKYVNLINQAVQAGCAGHPLTAMKISAKRNYVELYNKNVDKLGLLHVAVAQRIPVFYTCVNSLLEDIDAMFAGNFDDLTQPELLAFYEGFQDLLFKTLRLGDELIGLISEKYPPSTFWINLPG